jgi:hypothetical protein
VTLGLLELDEPEIVDVEHEPAPERSRRRPAAHWFAGRYLRGRLVEECTGLSIKRFVRTARRYRTVHIRAGAQLLAAEDPDPEDLRDALATINQLRSTH